MGESVNQIWTRTLADEAATHALGRELAMILEPGDLVCLSGDLGSGKTSLARAIIRTLVRDAEAEVPSPTFSIAQLYEFGSLQVAHFDFYRLATPVEAEEAGLRDALSRAVTLVEWPERGDLPAERLTVSLTMQGAGRIATLSASGSIGERLSRLRARYQFLKEAGWSEAQRTGIPGDASPRRYERLVLPGRPPALLMDMPARPDGPPVRNGLPYSRIAHLAEDISAVVGVNGELHRRGFSAPQVIAADIAQGLALVEDFGVNSFNAMIRAREDLSEPFATAVELLAEMARQRWPESAPVPEHANHTVPPYDLEALLIETELFTDWFAPAFTGAPLAADSRSAYRDAWTDVLSSVAKPNHPVWVLRDFHVDNLFWLPERAGVARVGLIDTQDCVLGHPAYDLVSMLQDARVDIKPSTAADYLDLYCELQRTSHQAFDEAEFRSAYAVLGAQRAAKILGIFVRLATRDGKPAYLRHLGRVARLLATNLEHDTLKPVRDWFAANLPIADVVAHAVERAK